MSPARTQGANTKKRAEPRRALVLCTAALHHSRASRPEIAKRPEDLVSVHLNRAYNARRQRVLGGVSPDEAVRRRMGSEPSLANKRHEPPPDACILPKALLIVEAAKEAS
jgi:hypothetical protein